MGDWLLYVLGAAGVGLVMLSLVMFVRTRRFVSRCVDCDGRVVRYADDLDGEASFPVVAFEDPTGRTYEITLPSVPRHKLGAIVRVTYYPTDPNNAWAAGTATPFVIPAIVTLAGLGLIVTAVIVAI